MPSAHDPDRRPPVDVHQAAPRRGGGTVPRTPGRERLEAAVCEAVLRYLLQQPLVDAPQPRRYYVARQGRDPDDALARRLQMLVSEVKPLSQCRVTAREGVVDRATGARGVIVQVTRLTWVHATAVDVIGGYYITHHHAASFRYRVVAEGHRWTVMAAHLLWRV